MSKIVRNQRIVTVDRRRWLTGAVTRKTNARSALYDSTSRMMCCLGFACRQAGLKAGDIMDIGTPSLLVYLNDVPEWLYGGNADEMMRVNDDSSLRPKTRERRLIQLAKNAGVTLRFKGRYPTKKELQRVKERAAAL